MRKPFLTAIGVFVVMPLAVIFFSPPSFAKKHTSSFGFSYDLPAHWTILSKEEAGNQFSSETSQSLGLVGYVNDRQLPDALLTKIKQENVEFLFDTKHSTPEFRTNISIQLEDGRTATSKKEIKQACRSIDEALKKTFSRETKVNHCQHRKMNDFDFLSYSYNGAIPGATTLQHEFQITHNVSLIVVGGGSKAGFESVKLAQETIANQITAYFVQYKDELESAVEDMRKGNFKKSLKRLKWLAQYGDDDALYNLGVHYDNGDGVKRNYSIAKSYYEQAAKKKNSLATTNLASIYFHGKGVGKDVIRSAQLYKNAAEDGVAIAQTSYGGMLYQGIGVEKDQNQALRWFLKAAKQGDQQASKNLLSIYQREAESGNMGAVQALAGLFFQGIGVEKNLEKGLKLLTSAAEAGYQPSQRVLARVYREGLYGVKPDLAKAEKWSDID